MGTGCYTPDGSFGIAEDVVQAGEFGGFGTAVELGRGEERGDVCVWRVKGVVEVEVEDVAARF